MKRVMMMSLLMLPVAAGMAAEIPETLDRMVRAYEMNEVKAHKASLGANQMIADGDLLAAVYTLEHEYKHPELYSQYLMVFQKVLGHYILVAKTRVGGTAYRNVELNSVQGRRIGMKVRFFRVGDAPCCPAVTGSTYYEFTRGSFMETATTIESCATGEADARRPR
jgi:hypothetical protein